MKRFFVIVGFAVALSGFSALDARASIMNPNLTFTLTNFPGGVTSISSTIGGPLSTVGTVQVFSVQTSTPGGGEWDDFFFSTSDGGPLAANPAVLWQVAANFTLNQAANFNGIEDQWTTGGANPPNGLGGTPVPLASLTPSGFINFAGTGPLGVGYVNGYGTTGGTFSNLVASGTQSFAQFVSPYSYANTGGGIPTNANGFNIAFHFDPIPQTTPEPSAIIVWSLLGIVGASFGWRRRRKAA